MLALGSVWRGIGSLRRERVGVGNCQHPSAWRTGAQRPAISGSTWQDTVAVILTPPIAAFSRLNLLVPRLANDDGRRLHADVNTSAVAPTVLNLLPAIINHTRVFTVTGGSILKAQRMDKPSNIPWRITVRPDSNGDVEIELPVTTDCSDEGAICTEDGRKLSNSLNFTVSGPSG